MKKKSRLEIIELFVFHTNINKMKTFIGQIVRNKTNDGKDIVYGIVNVDGCDVISCANNQTQLSLYLSDTCALIVDYKIHEKKGVFYKNCCLN